MQSKILSRPKILIAAFAGFIFILGLISRFSFKNQIQGSLESLTKDGATLYGQEKLVQSAFLIGRPVRLKIPKINVNAAVEFVGLTPQGSMDVPKGPINVAWLSTGPRPGENSTAVIAGHYGWKNGKAAAFDNLYKLRKGDKLYVQDENGVTTTFVVRESRRYDPKARVSDVFVSNDGKSHLNLITCEGVWDNISKSYSTRLVVFTDRE